MEKQLTSGEDYYNRDAQLQRLEAAGVNCYPATPPRISHSHKELRDNFDALEGQTVSTVGRVMNWRNLGNLVFAPVRNHTGIVQVVISRKGINDDQRFELIRDNYARGDIIAATGNLGRTKTGEVSVYPGDMTMLTKALRTAPFKVDDPEVQQRQRYLQTMIDPQAQERFRVRSRMVEMMRQYFIQKLGSTEMETPILDTTYGGASARPFTSYHNAHNANLYMRIANELYLKKMTVGGYFEGVFEFSRDFRNEGIDDTHNPEFTQVELYKPFWDYKNMVEMTEDMMSGIARTLTGSTVLQYKGHEIDLKPPWRRLTIYEGLKQKLGIDPETIDEDSLTQIARENGVDKSTRGDKLLGIFEEAWREDLVQPTFVMDYPVETSALTKRHRDNPNLVERFEIFVGGMEVGNCYTELNDPRDQRARFEIEAVKRKGGDEEAMPEDEDFLTALEYGLPQQAGIGISIDRWTMLLTNTPHIRHVLYFPVLRPRNRGERIGNSEIVPL